MRRIVLYLMVTLFSLTANAITGTVKIGGIEYNVITESNWASVHYVKNVTDGSLKIVTVPDAITVFGVVCKVKEIEASAFMGLSSIEKVYIGANVTTIGGYAFCGSNLKEISLPENLKKIGEGAFANTKLQKITFPASVREMGRDVCYKCNDLCRVIMYCPVGESMFNDCPNLRYITFHIENAVITDNTSITEVTLGPEVKYICFYNLKNLRGIKIPESVTMIGAGCFRGTAVRSVYVPKTVTKIGDGAFAYCHQLQELYIPNNGILCSDGRKNKVLESCSSLMDVYVYMDEWAEGNKYGDKVIDLPDRKAYLHVHPNQLENFKKTEIWTNNFQMILPMTEDELATNIDSVITNKSIQSSDYYTLSGQRVTNPKPGIYIQGGRKMVVK